MSNKLNLRRVKAMKAARAAGHYAAVVSSYDALREWFKGNPTNNEVFRTADGTLWRGVAKGEPSFWARWI